MKTSKMIPFNVDSISKISACLNELEEIGFSVNKATLSFDYEETDIETNKKIVDIIDKYFLPQ